jgi:hypothetical protein
VTLLVTNRIQPLLNGANSFLYFILVGMLTTTTQASPLKKSKRERQYRRNQKERIKVEKTKSTKTETLTIKVTPEEK